MTKMTAYYNEFDKQKAAWLRELIRMGMIAPGEVDERSIHDVRADDLVGYEQCHFFAGIGVWSYALRQAGWPDDREVWTGSCPCQSFSVAGKRKGFADERHLWPEWFRLIKELRPSVVFGEQVASKDGLALLDLVYADLEGQDYAVGALDICAAGFGAPHIRQRLYFVGELEHPVGSRISGRGKRGFGSMRQEIQEHEDRPRPSIEPCDGSEDADLVADATHEFIDRSRHGRAGRRSESADRGELGDAGVEGLERRGREVMQGRTGELLARQAGPCNGFWRDAVWLPCRDGKARPTKPGIFPLVDGATKRVGHCGDTGLEVNATPEARVMRLIGYGDAIVAPVAVEFIKAYTEGK